MAWKHLKAATESTLYDGQGSYKNIMYRICSLVRGDGQQHAGWCTASERYIAQTSGFSERQVQRAVSQFKKDGVFDVRTYRKGGKEFNHYRPNMKLLLARRRNLEEPFLIDESVAGDIEAGVEESTRQTGARPYDTLSSSTRQDGGVVGRTREVEGEIVNANKQICRAELRSSDKGREVAISKALSGEDDGGSAPTPPLYPVRSQGSLSRSDLHSASESCLQPFSPLASAAAAARSKEDMLAALCAEREPVPAPPVSEDIGASAQVRRSLPTTPFQRGKALVEETKQNDLDTYLRAYSLAHQFAGYLEDRKSKGEKAYAFDHWEVLYTADFIDALKRGWRFKDLEDAIDAAQTTKHRFVCCTPRRLFENGESVMKLVWMLRKKGQTIRQKLGERYASWYAENAGSFTAEAIEQTNDNEAVEKILTAEDELRAEPDVDEDVPILTLKTTGRFKCINPDCAYRFDTRELMHRHFSNCFKKAVEAEPDDLEEIAREESEDRLDDRYGIPPPYCPECYDEDEKAENWDKYAPRNADGGTMFNPWAEMDATCASETGAHHGC